MRLHPRRCAAWLVACASLSLAACQPTLPHYTVKVPPLVADVRPNRSVLFVAGAVPLDGVEAALDRTMQGTIAGERETSVRGIALRASWSLAREAVGLRAIRNGVELIVAARGRVEVAVGPIRCEANDVRLEAAAHGRPSLVGSELILMADPALRANVDGKLQCAGFDVPLAPVLEVPLRLLTHALEEALKLARVPVAPLLRAGLEELAVPREIKVEGKQACLDLAPSAVVVAPLSGSGSRVAVKIGIDAAPRVSLGACPRVPAHLPDAVLAREEALGHEMAVDIAVAIPHAMLQAILDANIAGKRFESRGQSITIDEAVIGDAEGRVLLRAHVHGAFNGDVFLWGTPALVQRDGRWLVETPDLQVALETRSTLERIKLGLWRVLDGGLPATVKSKLRLDVTDRMTELRAKVLVEIERAFVDGHLRLHVTPRDLQPLHVISRAGVLAATVRITAAAELTLQ